MLVCQPANIAQNNKLQVQFERLFQRNKANRDRAEHLALTFGSYTFTTHVHTQIYITHKKSKEDSHVVHHVIPRCSRIAQVHSEFKATQGP